MSKRKFLNEADPKAYQVLLGFEQYLQQSSLTVTHAELIKIRVSQINGCAYCIDKHVKDAIATGEDTRRIILLPVWRECAFFTEEEKAILALAEEMTLIAGHGVSNEVYHAVLSLLGQQNTTEVMMAVIAMNAWNRVGITTGRTPQ